MTADHKIIQLASHIDDSIVGRAYEEARKKLGLDDTVVMKFEFTAYVLEDFDFEMVVRVNGRRTDTFSPNYKCDVFTEVQRKDNDSDIVSVMILIRRSMLKDKERFYKALVDELIDLIIEIGRRLTSASQKQSDCNSDCNQKYWT